MIGWLKKLFKRPDLVGTQAAALQQHFEETPSSTQANDPPAPQAADLRQPRALPPNKLIQDLAEQLADAEVGKARTLGYSISDGEREMLIQAIEYRLRNPGEQKGPIPVRVQSLHPNLYDDYAYRSSKNHSSSASSPISDARLKRNVRQLSCALEIATSLRGVEFEWKEEEFPELSLSAFPQIGFIAQEVEEILPTLVRTNENGHKTVDYAYLAPVLVEAIKEQQAIIHDLQERVHSLEKNHAPSA